MPLKLLMIKNAEEDNKNIFTNKHAMIFENNLQLFLFLIITDTEHFVSALVVGTQEYRCLFANLQHLVQRYITDSSST